MALQPHYTITDWQNEPSQKTALNRTNLIHIEHGIKKNDDRIVQLDLQKVSQETASSMVKDVSMDVNTGVLTVTLLNGFKKTYDLDIEKVVTNFDITDDNQLVLVLADGTIKTIDMTRFVYDVASSATISMVIKDRVMTASIVDGSVTMDKLDAAIQTEFLQYLLDARAARDAAQQYQKFAKRYTMGDEEYPGSDTDNAKYYYEQSKLDAASADTNAKAAAVSAESAQSQASMATQKATSATSAANSAASDAQTATAKAAAAGASEVASKNWAIEALDSKQVASQKAMDASGSANMAKRYTVGGVLPDDSKDNAKYYYRETQNLKAQVDAAAKLVIPKFYIDFTTMELMSDTEAKGMRFWIEDGEFYGEETV